MASVQNKKDIEGFFPARRVGGHYRTNCMRWCVSSLSFPSVELRFVVDVNSRNLSNLYHLQTSSTTNAFLIVKVCSASDLYGILFVRPSSVIINNVELCINSLLIFFWILHQWSIKNGNFLSTNIVPLCLYSAWIFASNVKFRKLNILF